jgi:hypothetical protein
MLAASGRSLAKPEKTNLMLAFVTVSTLQKAPTLLNRSQRNPEHSEVDNAAR